MRRRGTPVGGGALFRVRLAGMSIGTLTLRGDTLAFDFDYEAGAVAAIKKIKGAFWDREKKIWTVPVAQHAEALKYAANWKFDVALDVLLLDIPVLRGPAGLGLDEEWIWVDVPYEPVQIQFVKQIPGITWDPKVRKWKAPRSSLQEAVAWADHLGVEVSEEIREITRVHRERFEELAAASRATEADLEIEGLARKPRPYQAAGALFAAKARRCFIADDMGLGKTGQAIMAVELDGAYPAVVVCPPSLTLNWAVEYEKWLPSKRVAVVKDRKNWPEEPYDVVVVGWSNVSHWKERLGGHEAYVLDESHYAKTPTAARTKAILKAVQTAPQAMVLCLTGTPITNRPAEYAPQLAILGALDTFGGDMGFYRRYCGAKRDRFGEWDFSGATNTDELNDKLRGEGLYIRRLKSDVLGELPPVIHDPIVIEGAAPLMREYEKARKDIVSFVQEKARELALELGHDPDKAAIRAKMKLKTERAEFATRFAHLRKIAARMKLPFAYEWIDARIEAGLQVVVAAHHREIVDEIAAKYGGIKIQGGQAVADVEEAKRKFQAGKAKVIVVSILAGKEGHTLTAAQNVLSVELPWTWADYDQLVSRCHRMGQEGVVQATALLAQSTVDLKIWKMLETKRSITSSAVDGADAAVDFIMGWE